MMNKYEASNLKELILRMYKSKGETFFKDFRGCFSGAVYLKEQSKWIIYTNQVGDMPVFYYYDGNALVVGSQLNYITDLLKKQSLQMSYNEECVYQILTYGYVIDDETYIKEVKRLNGGDYIVFRPGNIEIKTYHRFIKNKDRFKNYSEGQLINEIDKGFRDAVRYEWDKDNEYGYNHIADLSGGLDSRMGLWIAHSIYSDLHVNTLTYSKAGYLDEVIAMSVADYLGDENLFKPLDDIFFLKDIDENTFMLNGLSIYSAITGGKRLLSLVNLNRYGLEHSGMIGDVVIGSYYQGIDRLRKRHTSGMYSEKLKDRLSESVKSYESNYYDYEIYLMYARGFHGISNTHLLRRNYAETGSPFMNVDFMQLCFDIPVELRMDHQLYIKWILAKYPDASEFIWESTGHKITEGNKRKFIRRVKNKVKSEIDNRLGKVSSDGMNPIDFWLKRNTKISKFLNDYKSSEMSYDEGIFSDQLKKDLNYLYEQGNSSEQSMVLTVLSATKQFYR